VPQAAAFFPVYPAAAHALAWITGSTLVAGVLISLASGAAAAWALAEIARPILGRRGANDVVLYLALYPVGFVFTALYSDGLFLALAAGSFLAATRGKSVTAGVLGGLATGTRLLGLALLPALVVLLWRGRDVRSLSRLAPLLLLPAAVGLYALYLNSTLGDPWAFTSAQADWDREASPLGPLAGVPFAVKNLFDVAGLSTLAGSKINREHAPATADATLIARMEAAGAVLVGALNMGEYAYDFTGENVHDGPSRNPHDTAHITGGSSGGSGGAVAGGLVPLSLGSDTNGSIRVPSSFCGLFGLKPTYGRLSRVRSFPFVASLESRP